jgi:hypothetical protein
MAYTRTPFKSYVRGLNAVTVNSIAVNASGNITMGSGAVIKLDPSTSITDCPLQWNGDPNHGYSYIAADQSSIVAGGGNKMNITSTAASFNVGLTIAAGNLVVSGGYLELNEMAAPGGGSANTARIYAVDAAAKTRVSAVMPTGAAQTIATEP